MYQSTKADSFSWVVVSERQSLRGFQRGRKPIWHTILNESIHSIGFAKSSVLYLSRPLTLKMGCPTPDRQFTVAAEQADFVGTKTTKTKDIA